MTKIKELWLRWKHYAGVEEWIWVFILGCVIVVMVRTVV